MADEREQQRKQQQEASGPEKVRARLLALEWNTTVPATNQPIKVKRGDVVTISRDQFDAMNDQFRPSWEEVSEGE